MHQLVAHIKNLANYLQSVIDEKAIHTNYQLICENQEFREFKEIFTTKSGHTGITSVEGETKIHKTAEKIFTSYERSIDEIRKQLLTRVNMIQ